MIANYAPSIAHSAVTFRRIGVSEYYSEKLLGPYLLWLIYFSFQKLLNNFEHRVFCYFTK